MLVTRVTPRLSNVEHELTTLPEHLGSPPVFSGVRVARSFVLCVIFCRLLFVLCPFSFGHCIFCHSNFSHLVSLGFVLLCTITSLQSIRYICHKDQCNVYVHAFDFSNINSNLASLSTLS